MNRKWIIWRPVVFTIGVIATVLGCIGAWEYALKLEGGRVSYLVLAAPVVAVAAGIIPPIAHWSWAAGDRVRAILWWLVLIPVAAVVFFGAAERVHTAKAGSQAERTALRSAAERAKADLSSAKSELTQADQREARFRGAKQCGPQCRAARETVVQARQRVVDAEAKLIAADSKAASESPLTAPIWLLPAALDLIAFLAVWSGLGGPWRTPAPEKPVPARRKRSSRKRARKAPTQRALRIVARNDNAGATA
jgi:hypothetical protein